MTPSRSPAADRDLVVTSEARVATPSLTAHVFVPARRATRPWLVAVHGRKTDPARMLRALRPMAAETGTVLVAPDFRSDAFKGYQTLAARGGPISSAWALRGLMTGLQASMGDEDARFDLMGFSAGAQFAHRYALLFPGGVRRLVVAAAGWYTCLDESLAFPAGLRGLPCDRVADRFLAIPTLVAVGDQDTDLGESLRSNAALDALQGVNRFERASRWAGHLRAVAAERNLPARVDFAALPGVGHSWKRATLDGGLAARTFDFLGGA